MTNTASRAHITRRALLILALLLFALTACAGAGPVQGPTQVQSPAVGADPVPMTPAQIEAALDTIPVDHECVLSTSAPHVTYAVVADTDPRCAAWWVNGQPEVAPFDPSVAAF